MSAWDGSVKVRRRLNQAGPALDQVTFRFDAACLPRSVTTS